MVWSHNRKVKEFFSAPSVGILVLQMPTWHPQDAAIGGDANKAFCLNDKFKTQVSVCVGLGFLVTETWLFFSEVKNGLLAPFTCSI